MVKSTRVRQFSKPAGKPQDPALVPPSIRVTNTAVSSNEDAMSDESPAPRFRLDKALRLRKTIEKRKISDMDVDDVEAAATAAASAASTTRGGTKSGRAWKPVATQRTSAMHSKNSKSWQERTERRAKEQVIKQKQTELQDAAKEERKEMKRRAAQRKTQKEENQKRGMVVQKITNTKKIKKMSKATLRTIMKA